MVSLVSLFRTVSLRYLAKRWDRAALIVASISLGVAMLVSTQMLNECLDEAATESTTPGAELADLVVTANRRVDLNLLEPLRAVPGVASAQPFLLERVLLPEYGNRTAVLIGLDTATTGQGNERNPFQARVTITNPVAWLSGNGVVVGSELATAIAPQGQPIKPFAIRAGGRRHTLQPGGIVELQGKAARLGGFLLVMEIRQAARALNQDGICERIDLYLAPGADREAVRESAQRAIGSKATVRTPESAGVATREVIGGIRIGFTLCGIGAMVVGLFLVYNALAVSVAERRHDIGVLRSMGATRPQIAALFSGESVLLGLIGAFLGVPLGVVLATLTFRLVKVEMQQLFVATAEPFLTTETFLLAVIAGTLTAWLAALVPSMQAASDEPADAVRRAPSSAGRFFRSLQIAASSVMIASGFSFVLIRDYLPTRVGGFGGMVLLLVGMLLAVPFLVGVAARLLQPIVRRLFGIEARLAADNLLRAPGRTGVVVGALAAGVALMFQTAGIGKSNEGPILEWLERAVSADFFIICGDPASQTSMAPMQPDVAQQVRALPGVEEVMTIRYGQPEYNGRLAFLTALDAQVYHDSNRKKSQLPHIHMFPQLAEPNTCLVSENFAALNKLKAGDTIELQGPTGPVPLRVLAAVQDYSWSRGTIILDRSFYARAFNDPLIDGIHVFLAPNDPAALERVKQFTDTQALLIVNREDFNSMITSFLRRMYTLAYMQQIAVGVVAALGVVMALLISVLQRRRELGLLRAVGATQGQVLYTVLAEATLMGIVGTILGVLAGMPLEWYLLRVVIYEESGFLFPVTFPWIETLVLSAVSIGTATIAGLFPALHAVRLRIAESIAYE